MPSPAQGDSYPLSLAFIDDGSAGCTVHVPRATFLSSSHLSISKPLLGIRSQYPSLPRAATTTSTRSSNFCPFSSNVLSSPSPLFSGFCSFSYRCYCSRLEITLHIPVRIGHYDHG